MASIEVRGDKFHVVFRFGGMKFSRSLKTSNRNLAKSKMARLVENIDLIERGRLSVPSGADVPTFLLSDGKLNEKVKVKPVVTLEHLLERFFAAVPTDNIEPSTLKVMQIHQRQLLRIFKPNLPAQELTLQSLQDFVEKRSQEPGIRGRRVSATTIKKGLITLRSIWNWGVLAGLVDGPLPMKGIRLPKTAEKPAFRTYAEISKEIGSRKLSRAEERELWDCLFLTLPEIEELLDAVKAAAWHPFIFPMVALAAYTGARRSELLATRLTDLDFEAGTIVIHEKKRTKGKHTTRRIPMTSRLKEALSEWLLVRPEGQYLFSMEERLGKSPKRHQVDTAMTASEAHHHLRKVLSGGKWKVIRGWHVFRHSFCSNLAAKTVDQRLIDAWVGHTTDEMRRRYRHLIPSVEQATLQAVFG